MIAVWEALRERFYSRMDVAAVQSAHQLAVTLDAADLVAATGYLIEQHGTRLVAVFAEDRLAAEGIFYNYYVFEQRGNPCYLIAQVPLSGDMPRFPALAAQLPSVNWQEREIQDWFGIEAEGHPNPRRVALHDNWPEVHPLRKDFPLRAVLPVFEGQRHEYRPTLGEGVFQIPVGPVHAGIIEPGHFNFAVAGEPILYLQLRMFYTHKGTEKLFEQMPIHRAVYLAESISGDSSFSHGVAFCQAIERACDAEVPFRARLMRTILLELERICNHITDIGAIATDVGFVIANAHAGRLREIAVSLHEELTGNRLLRGFVCLGGVRRAWMPEQEDALRLAMGIMEAEFDDLIKLIKASDSTRDRLERTGVLQPGKASALGIVGVGGRASGIDLDVRRDHPYAAYDGMPFRVPVYEQGDVLYRMQVRIDEVRESIGIVHTALSRLGEGPHRVRITDVPAGRTVLSAVEGWRGEIIHWVRTGPGNTLERCKIKDPSVNNWPALVEAVQGNIVADFPVINKSFNLSYSGTDR